jgi:hypothetical protein
MFQLPDNVDRIASSSAGVAPEMIGANVNGRTSAGISVKLCEWAFHGFPSNALWNSSSAVMP